MNLVLLFKILLVLLLLFVLFNLGRALFIMLRGDSQQSMSQFLGRRVLFSALIIILLLIALGSGLVTPNPRPY
ncbi:DUF2909 domain-containing protein [Shewanella corallii]|uniref:DUF2909 domain-containing protein n=1 Tax=Shewanella corallii TaxID=560080 RepID=A0ABT0N9P2_9GAMM|nr:DUF2909 family protein [Shewanella corallii]MCL2915186.1 DUF2909 domain-containing protein [Shewanella corallii]